MKDLRKIVLVLVILATGVIAAIPFQRRDLATDRTADRAGDRTVIPFPEASSPPELVLRRDIRLQINPGNSHHGEATTEATNAARTGSRDGASKPAVIRALPEDSSPWSDVPRSPPDLSRKYEPFPHSGDGSGQPEQFPLPVDEPDRPVARIPMETDRARSLLPREASEIRHRIIDGDSLPDLADQYLGDRQLYLELYEYNRDILDSPDLLPIGQEIRIPARVGPHSTAD